MRNFTPEQRTQMYNLAQEFRHHKISMGEYHVRLAQIYG